MQLRFSSIVALLTVLSACGGEVRSQATVDAGAVSVAETGSMQGSTVASVPSPTDAGTLDAPDEALSDPLAPCKGQPDVFYYDLAMPDGGLESLGYGPSTFTDQTATWSVQAYPTFQVYVTTLGGQAAGGIELYTASGLPVPGTFAEGSGASLPYLQLIITDTGCVAHSGAFTIVNVDAGLGDAAPGYIHSLLLDFDLVCGTQGVHGCLRYSQ